MPLKSSPGSQLPRRPTGIQPQPSNGKNLPPSAAIASACYRLALLQPAMRPVFLWPCELCEQKVFLSSLYLLLLLLLLLYIPAYHLHCYALHVRCSVSLLPSMSFSQRLHVFCNCP